MLALVSFSRGALLGRLCDFFLGPSHERRQRLRLWSPWRDKRNRPTPRSRGNVPLPLLDYPHRHDEALRRHAAATQVPPLDRAPLIRGKVQQLAQLLLCEPILPSPSLNVVRPLAVHAVSVRPIDRRLIARTPRPSRLCSHARRLCQHLCGKNLLRYAFTNSGDKSLSRPLGPKLSLIRQQVVGSYFAAINDRRNGVDSTSRERGSDKRSQYTHFPSPRILHPRHR